MTTILSVMMLSQRVRESSCATLRQDRAFLDGLATHNPDGESAAQLAVYRAVVGLIEAEQDARRKGLPHPRPRRLSKAG